MGDHPPEVMMRAGCIYKLSLGKYSNVMTFAASVLLPLISSRDIHILQGLRGNSSEDAMVFRTP